MSRRERVPPTIDATDPRFVEIAEIVRTRCGGCAHYTDAEVYQHWRGMDWEKRRALQADHDAAKRAAAAPRAKE